MGTLVSRALSTNTTQERPSQRYLTQTPRGRKREKDGFHPRQIRDPNLQHRHPRCRRQGPHQRPWYQEPCQPTQPKKGRKKLKLRRVLSQEQNQVNAKLSSVI